MQISSLRQFCLICYSNLISKDKQSNYPKDFLISFWNNLRGSEDPFILDTNKISVTMGPNDSFSQKFFQKSEAEKTAGVWNGKLLLLFALAETTFAASSFWHLISQIPNQKYHCCCLPWQWLLLPWVLSDFPTVFRLIPLRFSWPLIGKNTFQENIIRITNAVLVTLWLSLTLRVMIRVDIDS